jgi:hypothetical protein
MPGPLSGLNYPGAHARAKCQQRHECKGPGCQVRSGKTEAKRRKRRIRDTKVRFDNV